LRLTLEGHPWSGNTFGVAGTITPIAGFWVDEARLPPWAGKAGHRT
jgi:hypothetical protein